jgi:hypothetical protein
VGEDDERMRPFPLRQNQPRTDRGSVLGAGLHLGEGALLIEDGRRVREFADDAGVEVDRDRQGRDIDRRGGRDDRVPAQREPRERILLALSPDEAPRLGIVEIRR